LLLGLLELQPDSVTAAAASTAVHEIRTCL